VPAPALRKGDIVRVKAGEVIPADGEIIEDAKPEGLFSSPKDPRTKALIDRYRTGTN